MPGLASAARPRATGWRVAPQGMTKMTIRDFARGMYDLLPGLPAVHAAERG